MYIYEWKCTHIHANAHTHFDSLNPFLTVCQTTFEQVCCKVDNHTMGSDYFSNMFWLLSIIYTFACDIQFHGTQDNVHMLYYTSTCTRQHPSSHDADFK